MITKQQVIDLSKQKFGRLTVLERAGTLQTSALWLCECECGNIKTIKSINLRNGNTRSCGCLVREVTSKRMTTHGKKGTAEYYTWSGMKQRCFNKKNKSFPVYGGRGITGCGRWLNSF